MPFPAPRERQVGLGELLRDHPQREDVRTVRAEAQAAVLRRDGGGVQARLEEVVEVRGGKDSRAIVLSRPRRESLARQ